MKNEMQRSCNRGSVMVEFALVLPILVSLLLGVVFFGYDFHVYQRLEESVRAGARFASMQPYDGAIGDKKSSTDPPLSCDAPPCKLPITSGAFYDSISKVVAYGCDPDTEAASGCTDTPITESVLPANVKVYLTIGGMDTGTGELRRWVTVSLSGVSLWTPTGKITLSEKPITTFIHVGQPFIAKDGDSGK